MKMNLGLLLLFCTSLILYPDISRVRKVAGSIPAGVIGFFIDIKSLRSHYGSGVDSASNRNEYQEYFPGGGGVKGAGA